MAGTLLDAPDPEPPKRPARPWLHITTAPGTFTTTVGSVYELDGNRSVITTTTSRDLTYRIRLDDNT